VLVLRSFLPPATGPLLASVLLLATGRDKIRAKRGAKTMPKTGQSA
jgi:hypothetical protein